MLPTVRVKNFLDDGGGWLLINEADFDPSRHELWQDEASEAPAEKPKAPARRTRKAQ